MDCYKWILLTFTFTLVSSIKINISKREINLNRMIRSQFGKHNTGNSHDGFSKAISRIHDVQAKTEKGDITPLSLFIHLTNPSNVRSIFFRLIKESKIRNKNEVIKIFMNFLNPKSLTPQGLITTFKRFDNETADELTGVGLKYLREVIEKSYGDKYDHVMKYFNEDDTRRVCRIFFSIFKETNTDDLIWLISIIKKETKQSKDNAERLLRGESDSLLSEWKQTDENAVRKEIKDNVQNIQKLNHMQAMENHTTEIITAFKQSVSHLVDAIIDDVQKELGNISPQNATQVLLKIFKQSSKLLSALMEAADAESIGEEVETDIKELQKLDHASAREELEKLREKIPEVEEMIDKLDTSSIHLNKTYIKDVIEEAKKTKIPDNIVDFVVDAFLTVEKKVDPHKARAVVEILQKEKKSNSKVFKVLQEVVENIARDELSKHVKIDVSANSLTDLKKNLMNEIDKIDPKDVNRIIEESSYDIETLNASLVADTVVDINDVGKDLITLGTESNMDDLKSVFTFIKRPMVRHLVNLLVDNLKLVNVTHFSEYCEGGSSSVNNMNFKERISKAITQVKKRIQKVSDGDEVLKKMKYDEVASLINDFMDTMDLKKMCADITSLLKSIKHFDSQAVDELEDAAWAMNIEAQSLIFKNNLTSSAIEPSRIIEVMNSVESVIAKKYGNDTMTSFLRNVIEKLNNYIKKENSE